MRWSRLKNYLNQRLWLMSHSEQDTENQQLKLQDTTDQATTFHTETDIAFFAERAERAGVELKDWLDSEPF